MIRIGHWIGGQVVAGEAGAPSGAVYNPATGEQTGEVAFGDASVVDDAVAAARDAFPAWRSTSLSQRTEVLFRTRELLEANRKELAALITAEHGKVLGDALGEVTRGIENVEFACGVQQLLKGAYSEQV